MILHYGHTRLEIAGVIQMTLKIHGKGSKFLGSLSLIAVGRTFLCYDVI